MREIRFRAWNKFSKIMHYDTDTIVITLKGLVYFGKDKNGAIFEQHNPLLILMQFTGLKDKNGKEIYEGDIVRHRPTFPEFEGKLHQGKIIIEISRGVCVENVPIAFESEVIGNIYENKKGK